jgi:CheY-like chemotaxis protein
LSNEPCRVLVVDDHRDGADSAVMLLRVWGHDAIAAYSPQEALALARSFDPDVVLIDIGLPGKNGFDLGQELAQICPGVRLVALTGFTQADIVRRSREAGFASHLVKPVPPPVLKDVVDSQCESTPTGATDS